MSILENQKKKLINGPFFLICIGKKGDDNKGLEQLVCDSSEKNPLKDIPVTVSPRT